MICYNKLPFRSFDICCYFSSSIIKNSFFFISRLLSNNMLYFYALLHQSTVLFFYWHLLNASKYIGRVSSLIRMKPHLFAEICFLIRRSIHSFWILVRKLIAPSTVLYFQNQSQAHHIFLL